MTVDGEALHRRLKRSNFLQNAWRCGRPGYKGCCAMLAVSGGDLIGALTAAATFKLSIGVALDRRNPGAALLPALRCFAAGCGRGRSASRCDDKLHH